MREIGLNTGVGWSLPPWYINTSSSSQCVAIDRHSSENTEQQYYIDGHRWLRGCGLGFGGWSLELWTSDCRNTPDPHTYNPYPMHVPGIPVDAGPAAQRRHARRALSLLLINRSERRTICRLTIRLTIGVSRCSSISSNYNGRVCRSFVLQQLAWVYTR